VTDSASREGIRFNRRLVVGGGVLIGTGGLLAFTGFLLLSSAVVSAARQWVNQLEQPPSELAKLKWRQARTATTAGAKAWRSGPPIQSTS
jgi:membrane protein implicated in regulation of membrane protease activity